MSINPITGPAATTTAQTNAQASAAQSVGSALTKTDTFLTLLVAQLKNQDPLNPADGTTFVTQLATFSGVEQSTQMRDDLDAIRTALSTPAAPPASSTTTDPNANPITAPAATTTDSSTTKS